MTNQPTNPRSAEANQPGEPQHVAARLLFYGWPIAIVPLLALMYFASDLHFGNVRSYEVRWIWFAALAVWATLTAGWLIARQSNIDIARHREVLIVGVVLLVTLVLRLLVVSNSQPALSDDIWRYLHDGYTLANGDNPYRQSPEWAIVEMDEAGDIPLRDVRRQIVNRVNHEHLVTIYQPTSQWTFAFAASIAGSDATPSSAARVLRLILIGFDLVVVAGLIWLLLQAGRSPWWALLYAAHPLALIEFAHSGHQDVIGIAMLLLALGLSGLCKRKHVQQWEPSGQARTCGGGEKANANDARTYEDARTCEAPSHAADGQNEADSVGLKRGVPGGGSPRSSESEACSEIETGSETGRTSIARSFIVAAVFVLAVAVKPIVLPLALPVLWRWRRQPKAIAGVLAGGAVTATTLYLPFAMMEGSIEGMLQTGRTFVDKWAFNSLIHVHLTELTSSGAASGIVVAVLLALLVCMTWAGCSLPRMFGWYFVLSLLLSSTAHPWYLLWALVFVPLAMNLTTWVWSGTILISYLAVANPAGYYVPHPWFFIEYAPVVVALLVQVILDIRHIRAGALP